MASDGPRFPNVAANDTVAATGDADGGTFSWSAPNNAKVDDSQYATATFNSADQSNYLKVTDFGFGLLAGSVINGIVVEIKELNVNSQAGLTTARARIVKGGTKSSTWKTQGTWPNTEAWTSLGSSSDLWGETWTAADINDVGFGFAIMADSNPGSGEQASVNAIRITVYFTPPPFNPQRKLLLGVG